MHTALYTFFFNQTFNLKWLSTPEQLAGLSIASKLYLVIYTKFVYCTVYVYKQHLSNLPNLSEGISEAAFGARYPLAARAGHSPARRAPARGEPPYPGRCCSPYQSALKCKRDLGIFPLHSFLISVCVSAAILLLSNTLQFGSISAWMLLPTATAILLLLLVTAASEPRQCHWPQPHQPEPVPSARANTVLAATCCEHMHTHMHRQTLFQVPKFTNSWRFCEAARAVPDVTEN